MSQKRGRDCTLLGCGSPKQSITGNKLNPVECSLTSINVVCDGGPKVGDDKIYRTRFVYNSQVIPADIDAALAIKHKKHLTDIKANKNVRTRVFTPTDGLHQKTNDNHNKREHGVYCKGENDHSKQTVSVKCEERARGDAEIPGEMCQVGDSLRPSSVNDVTHTKKPTIENHDNDLCLLYECQFSGFEDKFVNSILHGNCQRRSLSVSDSCHIFQLWKEQTDFKFGFIPCSEQELPVVTKVSSPVGLSPFRIHALVRATGRPNYMQARIPVQSQLNVNAWKSVLNNYWDQQLVIEFGFPLDFNRQCPLRCEKGNHSSASEFPEDIEAYLSEEGKHKAILGPFETNPIVGGHSSTFMTRHKPNSDHRRIIIDLSWPLGVSVNAGIDKHTYLNSEFELTFPSVDDITDQLKHLG